MYKRIEQIGCAVIAAIRTVGTLCYFLGVVLRSLRYAHNEWRAILQQLYAVGVLSLPIIVLSGVFIGLVLGLQSYHVLVNFGAEESVGVLTAMSLILELGPVVTGLLFAGRACSSLTAEIGLMRATEQIESMEVMGIDPIRRVVMPRFFAACLSGPMLTVIFITVGIYGSFVVTSLFLSVDAGIYWSKIQAAVDWYDHICEGLGKAVLFTLFSVWVALWNGYHARPTAAGVSRATTATVVWSSVGIFMIDYVVTALLFHT